jgi:hypothetical protein
VTDDIELRLQRELARVSLPRAPETLLAFAEQAGRAPIERRRPSSGSRGRLMILGLAAAALATALASASLLSGGLTVNTSPSPMVTPSPEPIGSSTPAAPVGFRRLSIPGVELAVPVDWIDERASAVSDVGTRTAAAFIAPSDACPIRPLDPHTTCAALTGQKSGGLAFSVMQYLNPLPGFIGGVGPDGGITRPGSPTMVNGQRAWTITSSTKTVLYQSWTVEGRDHSWYVVGYGIASDAMAERKPQVDEVLAGLVVSDWRKDPGPITDGKLHFAEGGVAFDYPASWNLYYPHNNSMMDGSLVLVASSPVAPCGGSSCQNYTLTDGSVAVEFRVGGMPGGPDWTTATERIGGQPAFRQNWTTGTAHAAAEGYGLSVRYGDTTQILGIYVSLQGPGLPALRAAAADLIQSVAISPK